jgi:hypothetical protein
MIPKNNEALTSEIVVTQGETTKADHSAALRLRIEIATLPGPLAQAVTFRAFGALL